jgi:hypothetical protein
MGEGLKTVLNSRDCGRKGGEGEGRGVIPHKGKEWRLFDGGVFAEIMGKFSGD